jgi:hypothetical protein
MAWFSSKAQLNKVHVTFIDDLSGKVIGVVEMPPGDLPESFQKQTTLHLGDVDWSVMLATPSTRSAYSESKKLTLHLRRIEKMDPSSSILYSLPSICDRIPPLGDRSLSVNDYVLHEDDWRQLELVSKQFTSEADAEIKSIRQIHEEHSVGMGWRNLHVRSRIEEPIGSQMTLADIARIFDRPSAFCGVTYARASAQIESGYSFTAPDGQQFYGLAPDGNVAVLAVAQKKLLDTPFHSIECLEILAREFRLDLVHWCRCERTGSNDLRFRNILVENAS